MLFNENSRVKIPALLHLYRLGYEYLSLSKINRDESTNIFTDIFTESYLRINHDATSHDVKRVLDNITLALDNEDLGHEFYRMLISNSGSKLIDFNNFDNNSFHIVTELTYKNGEEEFRPDITILINGLPLGFVEVKKPNNQGGVIEESKRMNEKRLPNKKFRKFINISQILVFSNNMEYDTGSIVPIQGAFYGTTGSKAVIFNCFREEESRDLTLLLKPENNDIENYILKDNNLAVIKSSPEFITNKEPNTPTNRILTAMFSKERLAMLLKYGIAYVKEETGLEKHIMRYPQFFATKAIEKTIENGTKKGIIWHTQGSGKTALAYYNVKYLTDYFQKKGSIPKFYFIVDRIDLLEQASKEFSSRGLVVHTVNSKDELIKDFKSHKAVHNLSGQREITVVNIQKFRDETNVVKSSDYNIDIQRVYFIDEAHRGYNLEGSFLANLANSDRNAVMIALTGTPLIGEERNSKSIFGGYIHKYYYNASIADGYTLKLIREGIETNYKMQLAEALKAIEILRGNSDKRFIYSHRKFVEPMLEYIVNDFTKSRIGFGDNTIGGMVVCDSSDQAKMLFEIFNEKYKPLQVVDTPSITQEYAQAAEPSALYSINPKKKKSLSAALILHDIGTKEDRKTQVEDFKEGKIDLLFVYNMLLTGFDAKRLKKLYIGRIVKDHNLLQTLTRVNRPYKNFEYGFVVDFADIRKEFDSTNKAYFDELQQVLGDEMESYSNLFKSQEEISEEIKNLKEQLFSFDLKNAELFSRQISEIQDRAVVLEIKKALENYKNLYNIIRFQDYQELLDKTDFSKIPDLYRAAEAHLTKLNQLAALENNTDNTNLLNIALEDILFMFTKVSHEELVLADKLKDTLRKTREALNNNFDKKDPAFVSLYEELERLFKKKKLDEITQDDMKRNIGALRQIYDKVTELNRKNNLLKAKYEYDAKYVRVHKRIVERGNISKRESEICDILTDIKHQADDKVLVNQKLVENEPFFNQFMMQLMTQGFRKNNLPITPDSAKFINLCIVKEYINEFNGTTGF
jgi:type I restriction enzyme, R subunit